MAPWIEHSTSEFTLLLLFSAPGPWSPPPAAAAEEEEEDEEEEEEDDEGEEEELTVTGW